MTFLGFFSLTVLVERCWGASGASSRLWPSGNTYSRLPVPSFKINSKLLYRHDGAQQVRRVERIMLANMSETSSLFAAVILGFKYVFTKYVEGAAYVLLLSWEG